jgi:glutaredoxin
MEIMKPTNTGFTVYSKSNCMNCKKIKKILLENNFFFIDVVCDEFVIEDKTAFLLFIAEQANTEVKQFPIIFNNGEFIGGFAETKEYIEKNCVSFDENDKF